MTNKISEEQFVIYRTPWIKITSIEQARTETAFLHKTYILRMYNVISYFNNSGGGFLRTSVNTKSINQYLQQIVEDAENGELPSKYSIGMNVGFGEEGVNTKIFEE